MLLLDLPEEILWHINSFVKITDYKEYFLNKILIPCVINRKPKLYNTLYKKKLFDNPNIEYYYIKHIDKYVSFYEWFIDKPMSLNN